MAYDRYDTRDAPRDERSRWREDRYSGRGSGNRDERGFFERAGDEVASWFGDDEAERRREQDRRMDERERGFGGRYGRDYGRERFRPREFGEHHEDRGWTGRRPSTWGRDVSRREDDYRPMAGDYSRGESEFGRSAIDPHYHALRRRHIDELDRDYEDYRRENQSRFENDFTSWRERRAHKRGLLRDIREHMEVVGNDDQHVGTIDRVAGDRIILTRSDPESGGVHHSLSCSEIDRVEQDRVILDCSAEQARELWRDESRNRALFEREDQGEMGPRMLDRSFEGTYR